MPSLFPWARLPWQRCSARHPYQGSWELLRCELRKNHAGPHVVERGEFDIEWEPGTRLVKRG